MTLLHIPAVLPSVWPASAKGEVGSARLIARELLSLRPGDRDWALDNLVARYRAILDDCYPDLSAAQRDDARATLP